MKGIRRNRPLYLSPSVSSEYDRRTDFDELARIDRLSRGRCGSRLVRSIAKLNCGVSTPKAETLMSQSDFTFEHLETDNRFLDKHVIDPVMIYPSFVAVAPESSGHNIRARSRRREDDSSDDALTAPRRFVSPSKLRSDYMFKDRSNKIKSAFSGCTASLVLAENSIPENCKIQRNDESCPFDIPECVVIPSMVGNVEMSSAHAATSSNIPFNFPVSPYSELEEEKLSVRSTELNTSLEQNASEHVKPVENWEDSSSHACDLDGSQFGNPCNVDGKAQNLTLEYSFPRYNPGFQPPPSPVNAVNDITQFPDVTHPSMEQDWLNHKKTDDSKRMFFLSSPSQETTKVSSLSTKLKSHQRNISLQSSDTSYGTTKSGATLSTSHSTSTGLSRSSRKTQALIERFERHIIAQKALERLQSYNPI